MADFTRRTPPGLRPVQRDRLSQSQFTLDPQRYDALSYRRCGQSGLQLPRIALGAWETFGGYRGAETARACIFRAFNLGVTCFDLANNYGHPPGRAETIVGRVLREMPREELVVATKAGMPMWPGPYGSGTSRKSLLASIDQSLSRLGLDHVDLFYAHRYDPETPVAETLGALDQIVRQGKALYAGLSNYPAKAFREAIACARENGLTVPVVHQVRYNLLEAAAEKEIFAAARASGAGLIAYSPLAQGLFSGKYLDNIPADSRGARLWSETHRARLTPELRDQLRQLAELAAARGQTLPQLAIAWVLRSDEVTTALIGASSVEQIEENLRALDNLRFTQEELRLLTKLSEP